MKKIFKILKTIEDELTAYVASIYRDEDMLVIRLTAKTQAVGESIVYHDFEFDSEDFDFDSMTIADFVIDSIALDYEI